MAPGSLPSLLRVAALGRPRLPRLAIAVLAGAGAGASAVGLTAVSAWLIARAAQQPPILYLMVAITAVRAFGVSRAALRYVERLLAHDAAFRILGDLRGAVYLRLERLAPAGLSMFRSGDLVSRFVADVDGLADLWLRVMLPYAAVGIVAAGAVALVGWLVPAAGLALATTLVGVAVAVPLATGAWSRRAELRLSPLRGTLAAATLDLLAGAPELAAAGAADAAVTNADRLDADLARAERRMAGGAALGTLLGALAAGAAIWFALLAGVIAVDAGALDGVGLAVVVLTPIAAHELVAGLVAAAQHLPGLAAASARVVDVLDRGAPVGEPPRPVRMPAPPYGLRLRGLRARYAPAGPDVLDGIDATVGPGERLLITGPSGSGKSTLASVLLRFLEPSAGTVELVGSDGTADLTALASDDVRRAIVLCAQDPHVFDTSVRENVRLARPSAGEAELREALRRAQLESWVDALPEGLDTLVGERGARLSTGQRQRLALARALLADAPIVIFDEPTEHLDEATATALTGDLLEATAGRTVLMITHRPELMGAANWSATLDLAAGGRGSTSVEIRPGAVEAAPRNLAGVPQPLDRSA